VVKGFQRLKDSRCIGFQRLKKFQRLKDISEVNGFQRFKDFRG